MDTVPEQQREEMFAFSFPSETPFNAGFITFPDLLGSDGVYLNYPLSFFTTSVEQESSSSSILLLT